MAPLSSTMYFLTATILTSAVLAAPQFSARPNPYSSRRAHQNFYLVTTSSPCCVSNSSSLPDVSALSLFDPLHQSTVLLRKIQAGYLSLPQFNITNNGAGSNNTLLTYSSNSFGQGNYLYGNVVLEEDQQFGLEQDANVDGGGGLSIKSRPSNHTVAGREGLGCLVRNNEEENGWTICDGPLSESVVVWKGSDASCQEVYLQAVANAPY